MLAHYVFVSWESEKNNYCSDWQKNLKVATKKLQISLKPFLLPAVLHPGLITDLKLKLFKKEKQGCDHAHRRCFRFWLGFANKYKTLVIYILPK